MTQPTTVAADVRLGAILFTDLVGFTEYTDALGDEAAFKVLDTQAELVAAALGPTSRVVKELGDGLMIWSESPAHGLGCAIALLHAVEHARVAGRLPVAMRMGLHYGEALARNDDLVGQTINIGARVADLAGPGELLASEPLIDACAFGDADMASQFQPIGACSVKGVHDPIWLHRLRHDDL